MIGKGIIFDLDGTLVDSTPAWEAVGKDYLETRNVVIPPDFELQVRTMGVAQVAAYFLELLGDTNTSAHDVIRHICDTMAGHYMHTIPLKSGILPLLQGLHRLGVPMCIATATHKELAAGVLGRFDIARYFEFVLTCDEVGGGKDNPAIFLEGAARLGLAPKEVVVVEDSFHAICTAKDAGFTTIGVYDDASAVHQQQMEQMCHHYCLHLGQLLPLFDVIQD